MIKQIYINGENICEQSECNVSIKIPKEWSVKKEIINVILKE